MKKIKTILLVLIIGTLTLKAQTAEQGLRVGDKAPNFTLVNQKGEKVKLYKELKKNTVVLTWYRGGWCPYCNVALKALSDHVDDFKAEGAVLFAITPEVADKSLSTAEKNDIKFQVLSDTDNEVGKKYDIVFKLDEKTAERYEKGFGLSNYNGNTNAELPIPATYVIDKDGIIRYAFVNPDYSKRAEASEILKALNKL